MNTSKDAELPCWKDPVLGIEFVYIEPGEFWMGSLASGRDDHEKRHGVRLTQGFWMATTKVTQDQFAKFVEATGYETGMEKVKARSWQESGGPDHPVVNVSWNNAQDFCIWLSGQVEHEIRLPTEAEWEYAARAGTEAAIYAPNTNDIAWFVDNSDAHGHPVGSREPNAWGLYDMLGNVCEWVADYFREYPDGEVVDPRGPDEGTGRVIRGGSWDGASRDVRAAVRDWGGPGHCAPSLGFRLSRGQRRETKAAEPQ